jgi:hypothetical protein
MKPLEGHPRAVYRQHSRLPNDEEDAAMFADRYTKTVLTVIALALVAIAGHLWMGQLRPRDAHAQTAAPKYETSVPKGWGKFVSFSNNNLLLEAPDGTYRIVDVEGKAPEFPKVKVQFKFN